MLGLLFGVINLIIFTILFIMSAGAFIVAIMALPMALKQNKLIQVIGILITIELCLCLAVGIWDILGGITYSRFIRVVMIVLIILSITGFATTFGLLLRDKRISRNAMIGFTLGMCTLATAVLQFSVQENTTVLSQLTLQRVSAGFLSLCACLIILMTVSFRDLTSIKYKSFRENTLNKNQNDAIMRLFASLMWFFATWINFSAILNMIQP